MSLSFFFFNDTATTEIYTLSLHDALPISNLLAVLFLIASLVDEAEKFLPRPCPVSFRIIQVGPKIKLFGRRFLNRDRKSTRLNSSHANISYAVFCLKKKN